MVGYRSWEPDFHAGGAAHDDCRKLPHAYRMYLCMCIYVYVCAHNSSEHQVRSSKLKFPVDIIRQSPLHNPIGVTIFAPISNCEKQITILN